jgi:outer membrane protein insertion porin family
MLNRLAALTALIVIMAVPHATAQQPAAAQTPGAAPGSINVCGTRVPPPAALPPAGSGPVLWLIAPCFEAQGNVSLVDVQTYLYYIELQKVRSRPTENVWTPYDETLEQIIRDDFRRLWATKFLDDLSIETEDYTFANGVVGKIVIYKMEERQRIKNVDYVGSKKIERSKIEEKLKEQQIELRLDTFLDPGVVKKVESIVREMMVEKGFQSAEVTHQIQPLPEGPKLVNLTFHENEGPQVRIRQIEFIGNKAISSGALRGHMKENKQKGWLSFLTGKGTYQENKYEEDAQRVTEYYRDKGYITAQIGEPELKVLSTSADKKTRWVELRIPVQEGRRYKVGDFGFEGNTIVKSDVLKPMFNIKTGEYYDQSKIRKGFQKAQEVYGAAGYMEFTGYPDPRPRDLPDPPEAQGTAAPAAPQKPQGPPIVDVTVKLQEGKQFFVNRITFTGNTTTRDNVIRREMRLYENGIFNTEALKFSVRRLNQLGYFKPLEEGKGDINVEKIPAADNKVDVRLKLEEQNRNQLQFGAGVSQFEGFFGQLSFQTSNFLGRGESLTMSIQAGSRAENYSLGFTEPFLFDRNITGSANLFRSNVRYIGQFTQRSTGGGLNMGFGLGRGFTRMFTGYSYERIRVTDIADAYTDQQLLQRNPYLADSLLIGAHGERIISKVTPSIVENTLDQPIFPTTGRRLTASIDLAGLGGNTNFYRPLLESVWYWKQNSRMQLGLRGQLEFIHAFHGSAQLPIFEKLFLGGEYSVRGFDLRMIGPQDPVTGVVLGGDKSVLFNVEQGFTIASPVRLILFYDAGQVRDVGHPFSIWEDKIQRILPPAPLLFDQFASQILKSVDAPGITTQVIGRQSAFKTSTGAEIRFFMPVLNVPFRLIFAYNPQRGGVLSSSTGQQQGAFSFRFAVGTMF